jgi:3-oxoacyl-[acyl-carrier protein] reductase
LVSLETDVVFASPALSPSFERHRGPAPDCTEGEWYSLGTHFHPGAGEARHRPPISVNRRAACPIPMDLSGRVAVVLGGSGGIGAATAQAFAAAGAAVVATWRSDRTGAEALIATLPGGAERGHAALPAAVGETPTLVALAAEVERRFGRADVLVNAAGFTKAIPHGDLDALDDDFIDRMFAVNWRGQFAAVRAFRRLLEAGGNGLVVNISSIAGLNGAGSNIAYGAAKAGVDVMTKSLARALAPAVRVVGCRPAWWTRGFVPGRIAAAIAVIAPSIPLMRVATAEDVARAVLACATCSPTPPARPSLWTAGGAI